MNEDLENQPPIDPNAEAPADTGLPATDPPAEAVENVTINRADYDRLTQASQVAQELAPIAELIRQDPGFADRLRTAAAGPAPSAPPLSDQIAPFAETFYDDPARNSAAIAKKVIDNEYAPQLQAQAKSFQLQFNRMAIQNFVASKRGSDSFAPGILPIFEQTIAKTTDAELANMDASRLNNALNVAYDMATGQYFRGRQSTAPKDQPPPIAGAAGASRVGGRQTGDPDSPDYQILLQQAAALRISPEKLREMWAQAEEEERKGLAL